MRIIASNLFSDDISELYIHYTLPATNHDLHREDFGVNERNLTVNIVSSLTCHPKEKLCYRITSQPSTSLM